MKYSTEEVVKEKFDIIISVGQSALGYIADDCRRFIGFVVKIHDIECFLLDFLL